MAFPTSPVEGQVYNDYQYDSTKSSWVLLSNIRGKVTISNSVTSVVTGSTVLSTYVDTGANITLTPGTYELTTSGAIFMQDQSGTNVAYRLAVFQLTDSSNNIIDLIYTGGCGTTLYNNSFGSLTCVITVVSTTTYKTRFGSIGNSGAPTINQIFLQQPLGHKIIATRLY